MSTEAMFRYKAQGEVMIPDLKLPEQTNYPLGKYAMMRLEYWILMKMIIPRISYLFPMMCCIRYWSIFMKKNLRK